MSRSTDLWVGKNDDSAIPPRVRIRVFDRYDGRCCCGCNRKILAGEAWEVDHDIALINGGLHREDNFRPLLKEHHKTKTLMDVKLKAKVARIRKKNLGFKKPSRFSCSRASGWKKKLDGSIVRRD